LDSKNSKNITVVHNYFINKEKDRYVSYIVLSSDVEYFLKPLSGLINLEIGDKFCLRCKNRIDETSKMNYCKDCTSLEENTYIECLYHSPKAMYNQDCTIKKPQCGINENINRCFGDFYLYIGRFGTNIKTGIGKLGRGKNRFYRLVQQGLNEAIIVYPFHSLPDVTKNERFLIDEIGIKERITFEEKAFDLTNGYEEKLNYYYTVNLVKELFKKKRAKHIDIYKDNPLSEILNSSSNIIINQEIKILKGIIVFSQGNIGILKREDNMIIFDISKIISREVKEGSEW